jgi:hypothetical protein
MRFVILRDDDTCAFTPAHCLERLYRPFLDHGMPVNLSTIPLVRTDAIRSDGLPEGFLLGNLGTPPRAVPVAENHALVEYLRSTPGYHVVQHGCEHSPNEFDSTVPGDLRDRLDRGTDSLAAAGFGRPRTFVAPYDKCSRAGLREISRFFRVFSTGWFELRRLPFSWWPFYSLKKVLKRPHWRIGRMLLLSHPGCLLSRYRPRGEIMNLVQTAIRERPLTVLVTHWWEYFPGGTPDESLIRVLHDTARWLADQSDVEVIAFSDLLLAKATLAV